MTDTTPEKPDLKITVMDGDTEREIKMSYGLEMDIRRIIPDPATGLQLALSDQFTQDYIIRRCLTDSKKMIVNMEDLIAVEEVGISTEDGDRLIMWALEHQLYFFAKRASDMGSLASKQMITIPQLPSSDGSKDSPSTTPSAGPSESSKETSTTSDGDMPDES